MKRTKIYFLDIIAREFGERFVSSGKEGKDKYKITRNKLNVLECPYLHLLAPFVADEESNIIALLAYISSSLCPSIVRYALASSQMEDRSQGV